MLRQHYFTAATGLFSLLISWPVLQASPLVGYEWQPGGVEMSQDDLLTVARDASQPDFVRARATQLLARFPDERTWSFYVDGLGVDEPIVSRRRAIDNLCHAFGAVRAADVAAVVVPYLEASDAHLRLRAAKCLAGLTVPGVAAALDRYRVSAQPWEVREVWP